VNVLERGFAKLVYRRLEGKMPALKRYAPLVGSAVLAVVVLLRTLGYPELALALESLGGAIGLDEKSPVGYAELAAAGAALAGVVLKIRAELKKARG
jgi:hypothetical protein